MADPVAASHEPLLGGFVDSAQTQVPSTVTLTAEDGVLLLALEPKASFEALREAVRELFSSSPDRFRGKDARVDLATRPIDLFDLRRLVHVLGDEFGVTVTGIYCTESHLHRYAERELKLKVYPRREMVEPPEPVVEAPVVEEPELVEPVLEAEVQIVEEEPPQPKAPAGRRSLVLERGLRSGQVVSFNGDVTVFGDVNPGAQLVVSGNIIVLGALKGLVHAGSEGDHSATVLAFDFQPNQLRIGRHIVTDRETLHTGQPNKRPRLSLSTFPSPELLRSGRSAPLPSIAWVDGESGIQIEAYSGRLPGDRLTQTAASGAPK